LTNKIGCIIAAAVVSGEQLCVNFFVC